MLKQRHEVGRRDTNVESASSFQLSLNVEINDEITLKQRWI